ncbi:hypothetical protein M404DRAFT_325110 [Pisolithus tinctorius Marx 270]|uniref:Uncharacterized protein n=1 Tax=Pisolithus tinctorius Marx 270 TaxID=870435 RepID=A0A0C3P655_PISTI|nr:hypothetical protein M404DRAFT_325110 [Pisolithus tinctorius Marx 270]
MNPLTCLWSMFFFFLGGGYFNTKLTFPRHADNPLPTKNRYGLWVINMKSLHTNWGNGKIYGLQRSMGYNRSLLGASQLYVEIRLQLWGGEGVD